MGNSISDIEQHLRNASTLVRGKQIPTMWPEVLMLMNTLGYSRPQHYKVCVSTTYFCCEAKRHKVHAQYVENSGKIALITTCLGLHFCDWFQTEEQCNQLMDHWHEKEDWLKKPSNFEPLQSELWCGRFCKLSWFWDPSSILFHLYVARKQFQQQN